MTLISFMEKKDEIPAENCFYMLFYFCSQLVRAPELPYRKLKAHCYAGMFKYCSNLETAPELPATDLAEGCYKGMFLTMPQSRYNYNWLGWVAESGTFVKNSKATWNGDTTKNMYAAIPYGWNVEYAND